MALFFPLVSAGRALLQSGNATGPPLDALSRACVTVAANSNETDYYYLGSANATATCTAATLKASSDGPQTVTWQGVALSVVFLAAAFIATGRYLQHNMEQVAAVSAVRCTVQLIVLGYALGPIFTVYNMPAVVLMCTTVMAVVAALEASNRPAVYYEGMTKHAIITIVVAAYVSAFWALLIVLRVGVDAKYAIPVMGMILGNTSSAAAVTLTSVTNTLRDKRDMIEVKLAMGATRWEAMTSTIKDAVVLGMTPVLNQMNIMGLVSIPGMMTGQILGGTPPALAARYQIIIMFLLSASAVCSSTGVGIFVLLSCSDDAHRLHHARLKKRPKGKNDPLSAMGAFVSEHSRTAVRLARDAASGVRSRPVSEEERGLLMTTPARSTPSQPMPVTPTAKSPSPFPSLSAPSPLAAATLSPSQSAESFGDWQKAVDPSTGGVYYFNSSTQEVSWSPPTGWTQ